MFDAWFKKGCRHPLLGMLAGACLVGSGATAATPLSDPMRPPSRHLSAAAADPTYRLTAILITTEQRSAVINGQRVTVGERVDGARLTDILATEVILQESGRTVAVPLLPLAVKQSIRRE